MTVRSYSSKQDVTGQSVYTVYVGDLPANPTPCGNDDTTGGNTGGNDNNGGGTGGNGTGADPITVLSQGHMDVRPWLNAAGDGIVIGGNQNENVPSQNLVLAGAYEMPLPAPTDTQDWSFVGKPGTKIWEFDQTGSPGYLWPGFASGFNDGELKPGSQVSLTLAGVSGPAGGDVWLWQSGNSEIGAMSVLYSSVWGLPHTWSNQTLFHSHNYWAFTQPGRYCLNFQGTAQKANGSYIHGSGQITIWVGDPAQASSVVPCDRDTAPTVSTLPALSVRHDQNGYLSSNDYDQIEPYLTSDQKLDVAIKSQQGITDPSTDRDLNDVIVSTAWYINGEGYRTGGYIPNDSAILQANSDRVPWSAVDTPIDWQLGDVKGPGTVTMSQPNTEFSTAADTKDLSYELPPQSNSYAQNWKFSQPGVYCIPFTMTVTPKGAAKPVTASKTLTVVAGSTDPSAPDFVDRSKLTTCANGQQPTSADGGDTGSGNGSGDTNGVSNQDVFVPNQSLTDSGAVILNNGHVDIASRVHDDTLETWVKDTTETATPRYHPLTGSNSLTSGDRSASNNGNGTVFQVLPQAETKVPNNSDYAFLGSPGSPIWQVTQTQQTDLGLLWPGWSTEDVPLAATQTGVQWTLNKMSGPGEFSLYTSDATQLGKNDILFNTRDGITPAGDSFEIPKNSHVHGTWSFTAEGTYCLGFTRSTTMADGKKASDDFTLAVAVGRVNVKQVDPGKCFTDPGKPTTQDIQPVPDSKLTSTTTGGVQVLGSENGFYPGQLVTANVGASHVGQWVSVWLHTSKTDPAWLGWAQVDASGAVKVRTPADATLGGHKLAVKTSGGDLIGWDVLALVNPPDDGSGGGTGGGAGNGTGSGGTGTTGNGAGDTTVTPPPAVCTSGEMTIIDHGHLDYSTLVQNGKLVSRIGDNSSGAEVFRDPAQTVLWLKPSSLTSLPAGYGQVGPAGSQVYIGPQTQAPDLIWLGWSTQNLPQGAVTSPVTWNLTQVEGPGTVKVFTQGEFNGIGDMIFDGPGSHVIGPNSHVHANWAFSQPGIYRLHFTQSGTLAGGAPSSDSEVVTVVVGDVDPYSAVPGGRGCANTKPADDQHCTPTKVNVISAGHLDWNTQVIGGKLESLIGDDSTGTRLYRDPASTVLWLKPSAQVSLPAGFSQIGPPGAVEWQVPQTQKQDLIWLGWSTELLNAGNASSPVTWQLTKVDGPGSVKVYTVGTFGNLQEMVFDGPGSHTIALGSHVHANWAFSAQGVYRLHFTQTAALANGQKSSDSEVLTVAVGNVDPTKALATGDGCGAISNAVLNGNQTLDAARQSATQAQADAAHARAKLLPGQGTPTPFTAAGNLVPLLLGILGGLLLAGGIVAGLLWWRRRIWDAAIRFAESGQ